MSAWQCIVQGCKNPTDGEGQVCGDCQEAFAGYMVHNPGGQVSTAEEIAAGDAALQNAYMQQTVMEMAAAQHNTGNSGAPERRRNQICWLCTERHTCTKEDMGWECEKCREVR